MTTFDLLFGLQLSIKILKITDNFLSRTLQKQSMSAAEGQSVAELTVKTRPCTLMQISMLSLLCVTASVSTAMSTFQCCHEKEKHQGDMKLELRMAHTVLLLRIIIVKHTMNNWIWQLQVFRIDSISLVITSIATLKVYLSVQLIVKHLMISLLRLWHSMGMILIHHNYRHSCRILGHFFQGMLKRCLCTTVL